MLHILSRFFIAFRKLLTIFLLQTVFHTPSSFAEEGRLHLGFIGGLSGPGKSYGAACQNGLEMARDPKLLDITYEDDQFDPKKTVLSFRKLVDIDKVDVVVVLGSSPAQAIAQLAQKAQIPLIAWASDEKVSAGRNFVVRSWPKGADEGKAIAIEAHRREIKHPALIFATDDYSQSISRGLIAEFGKLNAAAVEDVEPTLQDFKPILLKLKSREADALGTCLTVGQTSLFARQARELRIDLPIFGCISLDDPHEWILAQGKLAKAWYVTGNVDQQFRASYKARFGNEDVITGAAVYYDVANLLEDIPNKQLKGANLLQAILSTGHRQGAVGSFEVHVDSDDRFLSVPLVVKTVPD